MRTVRIELTPKFLTYIFIALAVLLMMWELRGVLVGVAGMLFVAYIFNAGLRPLVNSVEKWQLMYPLVYLIRIGRYPHRFVSKYLNGGGGLSRAWVGIGNGFRTVFLGLSRWKLGRSLAIALIYIGSLLFLVSAVVIMASEFIGQLVSLVEALPSIFNRILEVLDSTFPFISEVIPVEQLRTELGVFVQEFTSSAEFRNLLNGENIISLLSQTLGVFSSAAEILIGIFTVTIISVYMLQRRSPLYDGLMKYLPDENAANSIRNILAKIESSLGSWLVGQLALMIIIGMATYFIVLVPGFFDPNYALAGYAFPIAIAAALLEAIPNIGPGITMVLAAILSLGTGSGLVVTLYILLSFLILQNLEAVFIVPIVMKRAVGIDPILSILGIIAGFQMAGVVGAILAIPVIGIVQIIFISIAEEYKKNWNRRPRKLIE